MILRPTDTKARAVHIISEINSDEYKIMAFVISLGACLFKLNKDGQTPAMIAAAIHYRQVSHLLEQTRSDTMRLHHC